jgi:SNF2 family DNA or RNA helicase
MRSDDSLLSNPDLVFEGWDAFLRSGNQVDLSRAAADSFEKWFLARAALRFKLSKAVLIKDASDIKKLETLHPQPKPHQVKNLIFFWNNAGKRSYFADDAGLGKTYAATLVAHQLIEHGYISKNSGRVLVLCPKAVIETWRRTFERFGVLPRSTVFRSGRDCPIAHAGAWKPEAEHARFVITTYNSLQQRGGGDGEGTVLRPFFSAVPPGRRWVWDLVILDEAHRAKNLIKPGWTLAEGTQKTRTQAFGAYAVACKSRFSVLLSATPINNDLYELFSQSLLCQGKESPFVEDHDAVSWEATNVQGFDAQFCLSDSSGKPGKRLKNHGEFWSRLDGFLSRTTREATKEAIPRRCVLNPRQLQQMERNPTSSVNRTELARKYSKAKRETNRLLGRKTGRGGDPSLRVVTERAFLSSDEAAIEHLLKRKEFLQSGKLETTDQQGNLFGSVPDVIENEKRCIDAILAELRSGQLGEHPKLQLLKAVLRRAIEHCEKRGIRWQVVVFAYFRKSADAIAQSLRKEEAFSDAVLCALDEDDAARRARLIAAEFCHVDCDGRVFPKQRRILVATDALREGVDLHSANIVINYDLPWNPAYIEQRIGRLQRLNSPHRSVFAFNLIAPGAEIESRINDVLLVKARLINECFLGTYKFGVGEDDEPMPEEERDDDFEKEQDTLADILEGFLVAETESERRERLKQLEELRQEAESQLKDFKESEERAKRERPPDLPPSEEETEALEHLEKVLVPEPLLTPEEFARRWWRQNNIYPSSQGPGRWSVPLVPDGREHWAVEGRALETDELLAPQSTRFLELCDEALRQASVGTFTLNTRDFDWKHILESWLVERYPNLRLVSSQIEAAKPVQDWAAELPLRISHDWKLDGPDEVQPLLTVETAPRLHVTVEKESAACFHPPKKEQPDEIDCERLLRLDSEMRDAAKRHPDLKTFQDYYALVFARYCKSMEMRWGERGSEAKERLMKKLRARLTLSPGVFMCVEHQEATVTVEVADRNDRTGVATLTACLALGTIRENAFRCQQSKFYRPLDQDTLVITNDGKLVHSDTERRVCAEGGAEYSVENYANYLEACNFTGALFRKDSIKACARCGRRGWFRVFADVGATNEPLCPLCYEYSTGRGKPAAPEEFRTCPCTGIHDTSEFFVALDDGTTRVVHHSVVVQCDSGPRNCVKDDVLISDDSERKAHKSQFVRGALSGKHLLQDDPHFRRSPTGRSDTSDHFVRPWTEDTEFLSDEVCFCPNCGSKVVTAKICEGHCDVCKTRSKEKAQTLSNEVAPLVPAECFGKLKQSRFSMLDRTTGMARFLVIQKKPPLLLRLLSFGLMKPEPVCAITLHHEPETKQWGTVQFKDLRER